jgi:hypothetical protein
MKKFPFSSAVTTSFLWKTKNSADITSSIDKPYDSTNAVVTTPVDTLWLQ